MDISEINKVANRKRMNVEAEKLREKVSRETAKIIKLKVAQDTAYWDLKEKLHQVESNHEKLQQNMVEVQMQHESISGQYQEELRLRPETLNKLSSTREICDVLEDYSERLKDTLARCKADQSALCEAYQKSGQLVREMKTKQQQTDEKSRQIIANLEEKVKLTTDHQNQLIQVFTSTKQQTDAEIVDLRSKLTTTQSHKDELFVAVNELNRKLDLYKHELGKKEETISGLQSDIKQLLNEFNSRGTEMKNIIERQEKEIKEATESDEALKKALSNQENFTKTICDQNTSLQEKLAALEEEQQTMANLINSNEIKIADLTSESNTLKCKITKLSEEKEALENMIAMKNKILSDAEVEIRNLNVKLSQLEIEKINITKELNNANDESSCKSIKIVDLEAERKELLDKVVEIEKNNQMYRDTADGQIKEMTTNLNDKDKELDSKASTINQLMSDIKNGTDARSKLETTVQRLKKEADLERESMKEKEKKLMKQIEQLELVVRDKEDELSKQMTLILETRSEKERLQDKIQGMQNTIDNIQKELTGRIPPPDPRHEPEQDDNDNAVVLTPGYKKCAMLPPSPPLKPRMDKQVDSMLFNFLSDSSMDGDTVDTSEVNRRFDALSRGERFSPIPLSSLKRRSGVPAAHAGGLKFKQNNDMNISLSQVKNELQRKERSFFKNKKNEHKSKKMKN